jgi:phosphatidylinositol glycan class B
VRAPRGAGWALPIVLVVAAAGRCATALLDVPVHIDEHFQYLEPARWRLHGAGFSPWEYGAGLRSWVLPSYHGAWMAALELVGVTSGATQHALLRLHWACASLLLVWAAWRGGIGARSEEPRRWLGGLAAAGLTAAFPFLVRFAPHTLTENPSMIALVLGLVLCGPLAAPGGQRRHGLPYLVGALVALGCCLRVANAPVALAAVAWLAAARRGGVLGRGLLAALLVVGLFGLVDRLTWGAWFGSYLAYVRFNFIEGKAAQFGTEPAPWYLLQLWRQAGLALPALVLVALLRLRASWPYLVAAVLLVASLSTQPHKEPRFIVMAWPLLFIAAGRAAGELLARRRPLSLRWPPTRQRIDGTRLAAAAAALFIGSALAVAQSRLSRCEPGWDCLAHEVQTAQAWVTARPELAGLLVAQPWYTAGYLYLPPQVPMATYDKALLDNPLFDHLLANAGSAAESEARAAGFVEIHRQAGQVVLRR